MNVIAIMDKILKDYSIIYLILLSVLIGGNKDYVILQNQTFENKILYCTLFNDNNEYIIVSKENEKYSVQYTNLEHQKIWEEEFSYFPYCLLSDYGNTIIISGNGKHLIYNKMGETVNKIVLHEAGLIISPNGNYYIKSEGTGSQTFEYYSRNGSKVKAKIPPDFEANNFYLRFTPDNKIIALYTGQYQSMGNNDGRKTIAHSSESENINKDGYLFKYDPEKEQIVRKYKISEGWFNGLYFHSKMADNSINNLVFLQRERNNYILNIFDLNRGSVSIFPLEEIIGNDFKAVSQIILDADDENILYLKANSAIYRINLLTLESSSTPLSLTDNNPLMIISSKGGELIVSPSSPYLKTREFYYIDYNESNVFIKSKGQLLRSQEALYLINNHDISKIKFNIH